MTRSVIAIAFALCSVTASAQMRVADFQAGRSEAVKQYVAGAGAAYYYANATKIAASAPRLYCQPDKTLLAEDALLELIDNEIKQSGLRYNTDYPLALVLLNALERAHPCPK